MMDLPTEGVITGRINSKEENMSNIPRSDYITHIKIVTDNPNQFQKNNDDAGYDIVANESGSVPAYSSRLISTGLQVGVPKGYVGIIKSRSGLSVKSGIDVGAGVIDTGFTGELKVLLRNTRDKWFDYKEGDRIAQMLIVPICPYKVMRVKKLDSTTRGAGGFGSTGI